jgi:hypothetical protein
LGWGFANEQLAVSKEQSKTSYLFIAHYSLLIVPSTTLIVLLIVIKSPVLSHVVPLNLPYWTLAVPPPINNASHRK